MDKDLELLHKIAKNGVPREFSIIDDSQGTGRTYIDLEHDKSGQPYRLELIGPGEL